ncbi:hypothetical protein DV735_g355, partial [Chaetothyriales sp. CBS 134920]
MVGRDPSPDINEESPLISPQPAVNGDVEEQRLSASPLLAVEEGQHDHSALSRSSWYLILLTLSIGGLQIVWSVELSNGSPYLLSLGMSKALVACVWVAGPATGAVVQPYIGLLSDRCKVSWGKRKPFMLGGMVGTVISSFLLAYAKELMSVFGGLGEDAKYEGTWKTMTIIWATVLMWLLDFSINTVQAAIRAFICDGAPACDQERANAYASRIIGVGNVVGYIFGYLNLPRYFSFLGNTQFKGLVAIASIALSSTVLISVLTIKERNPKLDPPSATDEEGSLGIVGFFKQVRLAVRRLPPSIRRVCDIQFFAWMGWFSFLYYITTYVAQLWVNPRLTPGLSPEEVDELWAKGTRIGTFALLLYAIVSFSTNLILPFLVVPSYSPKSGQADRSEIGHGRSDSHLSAYRTDRSNPRTSFANKLLKRIQIPGLTLRRAWLLSQILYVTCTFSTFFISTPTAAIAMTAVVGISWALSLWAPFALISADIAHRKDAKRKGLKVKTTSVDGDEEEDRAGIILGLHNVAISAPQIIATLISSLIFQALQTPRNMPDVNDSIGWALRFEYLIPKLTNLKEIMVGEDMPRRGLPADFLWGYQIEGAVDADGRGPSIWDTFCKIPGKIADGSSGEVACNSYNRTADDISLLKQTGAKAYRFSISWSRIIPLGGRDDPVNPAGIKHYQKFVDDLVDAGIVPFVTLFHWDLPAELDERYGGFLNQDEFVRDFAHYARVMFEALPKVKHWITFNEPFCSTILGYHSGVFAPGHTSDRSKSPVGNSSTEPWIAGHSILVAHAEAVKIYRDDFKSKAGGQIGITLNGDWAEPWDAEDPEDVKACERRLEFAISWFSDPIYFGHYPQSMIDQLGDRLPTFTPEESALLKGSNDFYGMNTYTANYIKHKPASSGPPALDDYSGHLEILQHDKTGRSIGPETQSPWLRPCAPGFRKLLNWLSHRYGRPVIYVTENGTSIKGESKLSSTEILQDNFRLQYFRDYITAMAEAVAEDGVDCRGYMAWSLLDNFEWAEGYETRFGVTFVDFEHDQERHLKKSALALKGIFEEFIAKA